MKVSLYGLRARELALVTIVLMCTTFLIWAWEKTPLLTAFLPLHTQLLLTPDIIVSKPVAGVVFSESQIIVGKDVSSFPEKLTENDEGLNLDLADPENSVQSSPTRQEINSDLLTTTDQNGEIHTNVSEEEAKDKQIQEAEKKGGVEGPTSPTEVEGKNLKMADQNSKQVGQILDMVTRTGSPSSSSVVGGKDDRNLTILKENQEIHTNVSEEEAKDKQIQEAEKKGGLEGPTSPAEVEGKNLKMVDQNSKQVGQILDMVTRMGSPSSSSVVGGKDDRNLTILKENQACNYAKGKWVPENNRPLYSGFDCKQWLSGMWACRLTQRTDFAYEKLRWQPKYCQMEEFEGSKFLRKMQGKTLAFVGDSLGRQQYQSLMCMITGGKERHDVIDVGNKYGIIQARGNARPNGWAYRFPSTNTTILYYWSASLCDVEPIDKTNPNTDYAMHLDRPPAFLRQFLHKFDVLVLNTGHHWNRGKLKANKWVMYVGGVPNTNKDLAMIWKAKNLTIYSIVDWVNSQLPKYPGLKAFYRTISPRHFVGGDWNTGGSCDKTTPMSVGIEVLQDKSSDESAAGAVKGTGVKLLDITALSQLRDEGHISRFSQSARSGVQDCLHWCLPGVPDTWNEILFAQI